MSSSISEVSQEDSMTAMDGSRRYDRQIRIWGAHGQVILQKAKVCVLGAGPVATETLKCLVLGGIASFTIVDDRVVSERDLGNNFFFEEASLGQSRAEAAVGLLREMNQAVKGAFVVMDMESILESEPAIIKGFNLVPLWIAQSLNKICCRHGSHLMVAKTWGPFGRLQICGPELCIVESRPDSMAADLRLVNPWSELAAFASSIDMASCDDIVHKHVPYAVLLIKAIEKWNERHGKPPGTAAERRAFKESIQAQQRKVDGMLLDEENFEEALRSAHTAWIQPAVPSGIKALFADPKTTITSASTLFWVIVAAIRSFVNTEGHGTLPLEGSIPDMTATTELYLTLQRIYRAKADEHCHAVLAHAKTLAQQCGRDASDITPDAVKLFCKNARQLAVVRLRPVAIAAGDLNVEPIREALRGEEPWSPAAIFLAMMAVEQFEAEHGRCPGATASPEDKSWELDIPKLQHIANALVSDLELPARSVKEDVLLEFCRCADSHMHVVGAIMGGVAAQEAIKVLLRQFIPISGTFVYNGVHASSMVLDT